jgi:hypothetical protein
MSSSSPHGGTRTLADSLAATDETVDPAVVRHFVANNLLHAADQTAARVLVNYATVNSALIIGNADQFTPGVADDGRWYPIAAFGPFAMSVETRSGGRRPYRVRVALAGASSDGGEVFFAVVAGQPENTYYIPTTELTPPYDCVTFSTTSTTPVWLAPSDSLLEIAPGTVDACTRALPTVTFTGGDPTTVAISGVGFRVMAYSTVIDGVGATPQLYGVHIAEYYG